MPERKGLHRQARSRFYCRNVKRRSYTKEMAKYAEFEPITLLSDGCSLFKYSLSAVEFIVGAYSLTQRPLESYR